MWPWLGESLIVELEDYHPQRARPRKGQAPTKAITVRTLKAPSSSATSPRLGRSRSQKTYQLEVNRPKRMQMTKAVQENLLHMLKDHLKNLHLANLFDLRRLSLRYP